MELFTIGYEGRTLPQLTRLLRRSGVERLVDVRERPMSRRKGFSLMPLSEGLRRSGIEYDHQPGLGNPEEIRTLWKNGQLPEGKTRYRALLQNGRGEGVEWLVGLVRYQTVCLLCVEEDPDRCHRSIIAEETVRLAPGLIVRHL
jgi:uncharacterized protein (DUF488 family)